MRRGGGGGGVDVGVGRYAIMRQQRTIRGKYLDSPRAFYLRTDQMRMARPRHCLWSDE